MDPQLSQLVIVLSQGAHLCITGAKEAFIAAELAIAAEDVDTAINLREAAKDLAQSGRRIAKLSMEGSSVLGGLSLAEDDPDQS